MSMFDMPIPEAHTGLEHFVKLASFRQQLCLSCIWRDGPETVSVDAQRPHKILKNATNMGNPGSKSGMEKPRARHQVCENVFSHKIFTR